MKTPNSSNDPQHIYRLLKLGRGHELVTDKNVGELIQIARLDGHQLIERELLEWRRPARSSDEGPPSTIEPTPGFNRRHVRH